jgi:DNA ligase-associated metallophosphoesterase
VNAPAPGPGTALLGHPAHPLPERALWLPGAQALLVADAHFGKAVSFRRLGVPVPQGTTTAALQRLDAALARTGARRVVFLGDLLHSARGRAAATVQAVARWRAAHPALELVLVRGNHDRHAGDPPADWGVQPVDEPWPLPGCPGLLGAHHPQEQPGAYVLAGHVHPAVVLHGRAQQRLRLPCFHFGPRLGLLPAFGEFTGAQVLPRGRDDRVFVVADDSVRALPGPDPEPGT